MKVYFLIAECSLSYAKIAQEERIQERPRSAIQSFPFYYDYIITSYSQSYFNLILCYTLAALYITLDFFSYFCIMKRKIVALWVINCLAVSSAKAQFNTVSDNVCRYKVRKVEEKSSFSANSSVDSIMKNQPQQKTDSVDNKQKQWTSSYPSITYPLKSIKVTSPYGYRRDPFTGKLSWHNGLDLRAKNEPAYAMMNGIVEKVGYDNRSGNYVTLRHGNFHISYCHLSSIIVRKGESVFPGIIVGVTGNTGRSTGYHLHLTCKKDGKSINPAILFNANSSPL